ncbi:hypothetical protein HBI32_248170 [Parastagonospora nodorum]|nr:hypothetical protein HBI32_248170 [Parastagonospora nodorum]
MEAVDAHRVLSASTDAPLEAADRRSCSIRQKCFYDRLSKVTSVRNVPPVAPGNSKRSSTMSQSGLRQQSKPRVSTCEAFLGNRPAGSSSENYMHIILALRDRSAVRPTF